MTDKMFLHSECCMSHWKIVYDKESGKCYLICEICGKPTGVINLETIPEGIFYIEPCDCGCGNFALYSPCCLDPFELVIDEEKFHLECGNLECEERFYTFKDKVPDHIGKCSCCGSIDAEDLETDENRQNYKQQ